MRYVAQEAPEARARAERGLGMERMGAWTPARNGDALANAFRIATNPANTSVLWWGERLLALCEGGVPYRLEPGNLETLGEELFTDPKSSALALKMSLNDSLKDGLKASFRAFQVTSPSFRPIPSATESSSTSA